MNKKQVILINETQLKQIVTECVKRILTEGKVVNNKPLKYIYYPCATFKQEREIQPDTYRLGAVSYGGSGNNQYLYYYDKNGNKVYVNNDEMEKHKERYIQKLFKKMGITEEEWWKMTQRERELLAMMKLNSHENFMLYDRKLFDKPHYYDEKGNKVYTDKDN